MKKKIKLDVCETKIYDWLYPIYAREFLFSENYESFAKKVQEDFILTEKQWEYLLVDWEFIHEKVIIKEN